MKRFTPFRLPLGFTLASALIFAPQSALAQHGGGHSGGGHGGGGSHAAGVGGGHSSAASHATPPSHAHSKPQAGPVNAARMPTGSSLPPGMVGALNRPAAPGTGIVPFSGPPAHTTIGFPPVAGHDAAFPSASPRSAPLAFSGEGHEIWQEPQASAAAANFRGATVVALPQPPHILHPPGFFYPSGFYPGFGFYGFTPFLGFGWGPGCDPTDPWLFGCGAYGMGYGYSYPYGYGYGYGDNYPPTLSYGGAPLPDENPTDENSTESALPTWQNPPANGADSQSEVAASQPYSVLYLQDGTNYDISDYWVADGKLHYVTSYGGENSVDLNQVDLQRTVDANASRGLSFSLHPAAPAPLNPPTSNDGASPAPGTAPPPAAPPTPPQP